VDDVKSAEQPLQRYRLAPERLSHPLAVRFFPRGDRKREVWKSILKK